MKGAKVVTHFFFELGRYLLKQMKKNKGDLVILIFLLAIDVISFSQSVTFEGIVTYSHHDLDNQGNSIINPINSESLYLTKEKILNRVTSGELMNFTGQTALCFDAVSMKRYKIDYDRRIVADIGAEKNIEILNVLVFEKLKDEIVLSLPCDVFLLKYVHDFEAMGQYGKEIKSDTLNTKYFISKHYKIINIKTFAILQGNRNTKLIDGRFEGVPLKIEIKRGDGSLTTILATKLESRNVDEFLDWPTFINK